MKTDQERQNEEMMNEIKKLTKKVEELNFKNEDLSKLIKEIVSLREKNNKESCDYIYEQIMFKLDETLETKISNILVSNL